MEYTSPGAALSEGLRSGLNLATNFAQIKAQREQQKWERQLQVADMGMKLAENKNLPVGQRVNAFNQGVRPILARMGLNMPEMTPTTIGGYEEAIKNTRKLTEQAQKGEISWQTAFTGGTQHFTDALKQVDAETEAEKTQRELTMAPLKEGLSEEQKRATHTADKNPTAAEAIKRQSELQIQLANLNKSDLNSQIVADALQKAGFNVQPGNIKPEMVEQVKQTTRKELSFLNQFLPDQYRHKEGITMAEAKALKEKGFDTATMAHDFFVTDAPNGVDPLALKARTAGSGTLLPNPTPQSVMPRPIAAPTPMAPPAAGPLSLTGGAIKPSYAGPLRLDNQTLQ